MRKNYFITVLLSATLLISGCSNVNVPQTVSEDETKETLKTMQEQINATHRFIILSKGGITVIDYLRGTSFGLFRYIYYTIFQY